MNLTESITGLACTDCLMGIANGDWPELGENWTENQERQVNEAFIAYEITLGHDHTLGCFHSGEPCADDDCECEKDTFLTSWCDVCNSHLAGSRDAVTLWPRDLTSNG